MSGAEERLAAFTTVHFAFKEVETSRLKRLPSAENIQPILRIDSGESLRVRRLQAIISAGSAENVHSRAQRLAQVPLER